MQENFGLIFRTLFTGHPPRGDNFTFQVLQALLSKRQNYPVLS